MDFCPQIGKGRFRPLIFIEARGVQAIEATAGCRVSQWQFKAVPAVEPVVRAAKRSKVFFIAEQTKCGECGVGHRNGLNRLLVV